MKKRTTERDRYARERRNQAIERGDVERSLAAALHGKVGELLRRDYADELAELLVLLERGTPAQIERAYHIWTIRIARLKARAYDAVRQPQTMFELMGQQRFELARLQRAMDRMAPEVQPGEQLPLFPSSPKPAQAGTGARDKKAVNDAE